MAALDIVFRKPDGAEEVRTFYTKPIGVEFVRRMPLTVTQARAESQELGVQKGWVMTFVGGKSIEHLEYNAACEVFKQAVYPLKPSFGGSMKDKPATPHGVTEMCAKVGPLDAPQVPAFLQRYGYHADTPSTWEKNQDRPELVMNVISSENGDPKSMSWFLMGGGDKADSQSMVWYSIQCCLDRKDGRNLLCWQVDRRLAHLRALLHDPLKEELGGAYDKLFAGAHFAHRTGLRSSATRLEGWFAALGSSVNKGLLPPKQTARVLRFLEVPEFRELPAAPESETTGLVSEVTELAGEPNDQGEEETPRAGVLVEEDADQELVERPFRRLGSLPSVASSIVSI